MTDRERVTDLIGMLGSGGVHDGNFVQHNSESLSLMVKTTDSAARLCLSIPVTCSGVADLCEELRQAMIGMTEHLAPWLAMLVQIRHTELRMTDNA